MAVVVPSQVVDYIKTRYPTAKDPDFWLDNNYAPSIAHLLGLVENIPPHLVTLQGVAAAEFGESIAAIRIAVSRWTAGDKTYVFKGFAGYRRIHPIALLQQHLSALHDEGAEPTTSELSFISDVLFRDALRQDLGSIDRCFQNREWKATTVLGGSIIEALLLYVLREYEKTNARNLQSTVLGLQKSGALNAKPPRNLDDWVLHELTEVSAAVGLIQKETAAQCRIAKNFRNLVHPGRATRLAQQCDRPTALSALAAVEHVIRDLTP